MSANGGTAPTRLGATQAAAPTGIHARLRLRRELSGVPGWLFEREAWRLRELARRCAGTAPDAAFVEIGSFHGRSTIALANGIEAGGGRGPLYSIDPQDDDRHAALLANLEQAGVRDRVRIVRARSSDARPGFEDVRAALLFVDGSHDYEDVRDDLAQWIELLEPDSVIAINDPFWDGVNRVLRERLARRGSPYRRPGYCGNTIHFLYRPGAPWTWRDSWARARTRAVLVAGGIWYGRYHDPILYSRIPRPIRQALVWPPVWILTRLFGLLLPGGNPHGR